MIKHIVEVTVNNASAEQFYDFMINPNDKNYNEWWAEEHIQFHITKKGDKNHLGDNVYFDEYLGKKRKLKFHAVVIVADRPNKIIWQMKIASLKSPFFVKFELTEKLNKVIVKHELMLGYEGIGSICDSFIGLVFNKEFRADLEKHCNIEWQKLAEYLNKDILSRQNEIINYLSIILGKLCIENRIDLERLYEIAPKIIFAPDNKFGEVINEIDPDVKYTNEEKYKCAGKILLKDGRYYLVIRAYFLADLLNTNYKDIYAKFTICHELGHWTNYVLNPELYPSEKLKYIVSLLEGCRLLFAIAIDEYMANNYIAFLLEEEECDVIIKNDELYKDLDILYENIETPFDLYSRIWNSPNSIFKNLLSHMPLYKKCGGYKKDEILELIDIDGIIALLEKDKKEKLFEHLVYSYNLIVKDYNSDNPEIMQKYIQ
jgi:predicted transport protein